MDEQPDDRGGRRGEDGDREERRGSEESREDAALRGGEEPEGRGGDEGDEDDGGRQGGEPPRKLRREDEERVFDETFIRDAEVNEPAARTRMLRERWREQPPEPPQPWRSDEPPAGWFFGRARRKARKRRRRRGRGR